jgi:hypothetical protein
MLVPRAEASDDRAYHAALLTQIARAQGLQHSFAPAHATLDAAHALLADPAALARQPLMQAMCRYLLERGRVLNTSG